MTFLDTIILGAIEGFTEFLPVSSTAHLILASKLLKLENSEFLKSFEISIQLGAILAVAVLYRKMILSKLELNKKIMTAFIPAAFIGLAFYGVVKGFFFDNHLVSVYALLIGGLAIVLFEFFHKEKGAGSEELDRLSYKKAAAIGFFQSIAVIPGVSRAAATILGGMFLGLNRKSAIEFSFLLALPTMAGATGLDLIKSAGDFSNIDFLNLAVGFSISFLTALTGMKFLLRFIQNHNFTAFGFYRIIIALFFLAIY